MRRSSSMIAPMRGALLAVMLWSACAALALAESSALPAPPTIKDEAFENADTDHNGMIDQAEFASYTLAIRKALNPFMSTKFDIPAQADGNANAGAAGVLRGNRPRLNAGNKFWSGFATSIFTIWATEIGDKTFFIAAILSMKRDRVVVFAGAIGALIVMTVLSVVMGSVASQFLPPHLTHYAGGVLFVVFGCKMLYDSREMSASGPSEELTEVEEELEGKKSEEESDKVEVGEAKASSAAMDGMIQVFTQAFLLTFLAEWGDRSQIATVTLAATKDAFGVTLGGICCHSMCTGIAVVGGKFLASRISERTVTIVGGVLFLLFALHSFVVGPGA
ncbi:TPA: hypothetical protein N0F65_002034 [Lagenidium giganteum]|uniref:GDT1 family protein n=1 Tax=Lagenidium giganteum TaxID=4803 RepID=A0AAV2Z151_9STRA|nr:TPA: hypothetical protein N0F65_002034 [Lagenidium giganteum]